MDFSFIQITDHHLAASETELVSGFPTRQTFRAALRHIAQNVGHQADFIISTGDLVNEPSETGYQAFLHMLNAQNASSAAPGPLFISAEGLQDFPMYLLPGNHDDRNHFIRCLFPKSAPMPLMNAVFTHKGIQFICLDLGPDTKATLHAETLHFLAQSLQTNLPAIILTHHHLVPIGSPWLDNFIADDMTRFWDTVTGKNVLGIFSGHFHTTCETVVHDIPVFGLRATAFSLDLQEPRARLAPPHYRLATLQNGLLTTQIFEVPL